MSKKRTWTPWHEVVSLRDDLKSGELSLAVFAADLYDVLLQKGQRKVYEDPAEFFALTYPTLNLRELARDVAMRLAGRSDKAYRKLSVTYGGGKTHTLITLRHLVHDPRALPNLPAVRDFKAHIDFPLPHARVAALCFDKIDLELGVESPAPDGSTRMLRHPWSVLAYQLAGADGLRMISASGKDEERDTPPAEPLIVDLLSKPQEEGLSTLVLLDEALMYLRAQVETDQSARGRMVAFFQYLTQAVVKVDRCAMVASLLASDPGKHDELGNEILRQVSEVFGRQEEEDASPVSREDVSEVLRRRFFKPESISDPGRFSPHVTSVVNSLAALDPQTKKERKATEDRYLRSYPFHPDLTEIFYSRWTQMDGFQRTRGILRTFAIALRDAEKWDTNPLVGPNVFLSRPGDGELAEATSDLAAIATSEASAGGHQAWRPILEGELDKARTVQADASGLNGRELEQAVISVFLSSQPVGQKAQTRALLLLLGTARPDKIELEKALVGWTYLSWFLDEVEMGATQGGGDGAEDLPKAWRLGNRPNLRQMHDDACRNRVPPQLVESQLVEAIRKEKSLTGGAAAAGARVHTLPQAPRDVQDDGEFHFAVLGPEAASDSGKPSAEARRFIDETTAADRPRVNRNAIVLAVPSKEGLETARDRLRHHLGWQEVRNLLKDQPIDPIREQMLVAEMRAAGERIAEGIRQAYSIVVTVNEANDVHAFRIAATGDPLFTTIKADRRARIQETAISAEAMMPNGPYDLWHEGEQERRVKNLVGAFAQFAKLPKMLRHREILGTVVQGIESGIWVGRTMRPDRTYKSYWRTRIDDTVLKDTSLEVCLPDSATLSDLNPALLAYGELPELWQGDEISVQSVYDYFAGERAVEVPKEGYEEIFYIPACRPDQVNEAISQAVAQGSIWMTNGPASILGEPIPAGVLTPAAVLRPPPASIVVGELMAEEIADAWQDGKSNALVIMTAISAKRGVNLPWSAVRSAIGEGIRAQWLELAEGSAPLDTDLSGAQGVLLQTPAAKPGVIRDGTDDYREGVLTAEATLEGHGIQDLAEIMPEILEAAAEDSIKFRVRIEFGGKVEPDRKKVERINALLSEALEELRLGGGRLPRK
ncbi:MAG: DUF499 domain-containing protein [Caldilineaceae bacterium]|nr:DUF499 domain-containing protein [Caldilineaceae bacterium]